MAGALLLVGFVLSRLPRQGLARSDAQALDWALDGYRRRQKAGLIRDDGPDHDPLAVGPGRRLRKALLNFDGAQRRTRYPGAGPGPVDPRRCRCWEAQVLLGPSWDRYARSHLQVRNRVGPAGTWLLHCPDTGVGWVELPRRGVRFRQAWIT